MSVTAAAPPDPFVLNDVMMLTDFPYRKTSGLTARAQAYNSGISNLCLILAGQSNLSTVLPTLHNPTNTTVIDQMNIYDGGSYELVGSPLGVQVPTALGGAGNVTAYLADEAIAAFARVIVINCAVSGTKAADWATGQVADRLPVAVRRILSRGYTPGATGLAFAISWWQGESDHGTSGASYGASMATILANAQAAGFSGASCRFFMNVETIAGNAVDATIQTAQAAFINGTTVFAGGNIDTLTGGTNRTDGTHLTNAGGSAAAALVWAGMHASGAPY